ncbi:MAG: hypothetical protein IH956_07560 [Chloroflexi bacterium]|nr:hypothetical protein [Chloroflexota bacterium]
MAQKSAGEVTVLCVPLKSEYVSVLRATAGVIAGNMTFNYDEIMQVRIAVSEVFDLGVKQVAPEGPADSAQITFSFARHLRALEIVVTEPEGVGHALALPEWQESRALIETLMDEVELGGEGSAVRMVKYGPGGQGAWRS